MANINKIRLSGQTYDIQDPNASKTVELTQAQYDALVTVDPNTFYIITDATAGDLSNYYTKSETSGATELATAFAATQPKLSAGTNITIDANNVISAEGGGGKAINAGRGISITTGETADTVSFNLPISGGSATNSIIIGAGETGSLAGSLVHGIGSRSNGTYSTVFGYNCFSNSNYSFLAGGHLNNYNTDYGVVFGKYNSTTNSPLFSVGNGTADNARHNAFEIRQNGDIYLSSGGTDIKLQDNLGGGGGIDSGTVQTMIDESLSGYVTTNTLQDITEQKTFVGDPINKKKSIKFKQYDDASKVGFVMVNSAETNNEIASFEFRPNTFTIDNVQHPLLYFGHYRNTSIANAGVPQTVIGFRQYDQKNAAAYHYLMPLPEKAKTPFSLTTSFKDYYAPMGFKNGSTMITADNTGVVDLSSELGGLKLKKLTQAQYDALSPNYDSNTLYVIVN